MISVIRNAECGVRNGYTDLGPLFRIPNSAFRIPGGVRL